MITSGHGTSLFAALEVATGKITTDACYQRHTNVEFLAFLKLVAMNRPGMSGDSTSWEGWSHVRWFVEEVPAGAA